MNLIDYLLLWLKVGERPPREVLLIGTRQPTQLEVGYGKMLENETAAPTSLPCEALLTRIREILAQGDSDPVGDAGKIAAVLTAIDFWSGNAVPVTEGDIQWGLAEGKRLVTSDTERAAALTTSDAEEDILWALPEGDQEYR